MKRDITTIQLEKTTKNMLVSIGRKNETYDDIVVKLIKNYQENNKGMIY
ncbi:hypothetical protein [Methanosphaera stadtmanae]|nr:hypothetical protein [Methanosphaera stadtmanae]